MLQISPRRRQWQCLLGYHSQRHPQTQSDQDKKKPIINFCKSESLHILQFISSNLLKTNIHLFRLYKDNTIKWRLSWVLAAIYWK